jgi:hypothetical protein
MRKRTVTVNDKMQKGYRYVCSEPIGRNFDPEFSPELTLQEMLRLGVFVRYTMGRRLPEEDRRQIKRWKAMRRHIRQIERNCEPGHLTCRPRQRQALLHWAYDSRRI